MKKYIIYVFLTVMIVFGFANVQAQEPVIRFAYKADKGGNVFMLDEAIRGNYEIIVDEFINFKDSSPDYLQMEVKRYLDKDPAGIKSNGTSKFFMLSEDNKDISGLSKYTFGAPLYISTHEGVYDGKVASYYLNCCDDFMAGTFYPVLSVDSYRPIQTAGYDFNKNIYLVSDKPGITKISFDEESDMSKRHGVFTMLDKVYKVSITKGEDTQEEIKVFSGSFTGKGKTEYIASYRDHPDFHNYVSGIFILDESFNKVAAVKSMSEKNFYYDMAIGTVDVNGDGIHEIITETGYYEGAGYELWGYKNGSFEMIASGFFFGV